MDHLFEERYLHGAPTSDYLDMHAAFRSSTGESVIAFP